MTDAARNGRSRARAARRTTVALAALLGVGASGCGRLGFEHASGFDATPCTGAVCGDAGSRDASLDGGAPDAPSMDAGPRDAPMLDGGTDAGPPTPSCTDLAGRACTVEEICFVEPVTTLDVGACCPGSDCLDRRTRLVAEALRASSPVSIDGDASEWASAPRWPITNFTDGGSKTTADFSGFFSVRWDDARIYLLVSVLDDVVRPLEEPLAFDNDSIELYLDMDAHTLDATWEAGEEAWCHVQRDDTIMMGGTSPAFFPSAAAFTTTADGWVLEVSVDWPGVRPGLGTLIGLDLALNDHDLGPGSGRQSQLFWSDAMGRVWDDPQLFGLLRLASSMVSSGLPVCGDAACAPGENTTNCAADCP